ncbi:hybrid sensor histidine kinase/response regulator [Sulfurimonas sp.]|jgi:CheY-like chemotaxis protein|uniref:hybrid sensor histidine kinase/response regulator n=1 Tax=Sulfurimonas sp. TaxID=2022749 RepID=UPI0025DC7D72|nr:hybrid sensor histidine kinase/response regulator [Sulfurimonas sp.]MBT5935432.1 hybrid sensor histidine kinase/response regulator [Sulfurimonas sp.]
MKIDFHSKNILIVDDLNTNIIFLKILLTEEGYSSVYTADSAKKAYSILETHNIELILLDISMPDIDGIEATKYIRNQESYKHIPIMMVTADTTSQTLEKSFDAGANDYITKPVNIANLRIRAESLFMSAYKDAIIQKQDRLLAVNDTVKMLAHQWRQPIASIAATTMSISVKNELETLESKDLNIALSKINDYLQNLSRSIDDFAQLSKIETESSCNDINTTIKESLALIKDNFIVNNIVIKTNLTSSKPVVYFKNELLKILVSIYKNSIEAFQKNNIDNGKNLKITTHQTDEITKITITDNAGGIDASVIEKIFDPYVSTKKEKNGVGLGLYNAVNILRDYMNASIHLESDKGVTTVTIQIPNQEMITS